MVFSKFLLTLFFIFCGLNSKKAIHREILHFEKHSSLRNQFGKRTMFLFFVFFFHFLCKFRISASPLSVTKNKKTSKFSIIFFKYYWLNLVLLLDKCKFLFWISNLTHLNHFYSIVFAFSFIYFFLFDLLWNANVGFEGTPSYVECFQNQSLKIALKTVRHRIFYFSKAFICSNFFEYPGKS